MLGSAILGTVGLLGAATIAWSGLLGDRQRAQPAKPTESSISFNSKPPAQLVLVRRRGGIPPNWAGRLRRARGVTAVAHLGRTQALLRSSARERQATVDAAPAAGAHRRWVASKRVHYRRGARRRTDRSGRRQRVTFATLELGQRIGVLGMVAQAVAACCRRSAVTQASCTASGALETSAIPSRGRRAAARRSWAGRLT